jgi:hypothetical protein
MVNTHLKTCLKIRLLQVHQFLYKLPKWALNTIQILATMTFRQTLFRNCGFGNFEQISVNLQIND